jgi:hypothetical protein
MIDPELKAREEAKREAAWEPAERWRVIQETMSWAAAQDTVRRNTKETCLRLQREKLALLEELQRRQHE